MAFNKESVVISVLPDAGKSSRERLLVLGQDVAQLSPVKQFICGCAGTLGFYLVYGYFLELIFKLEGIAPYGWYMTLVQFFFYTVFALTENAVVFKKVSLMVPIRTYAALAFLTVATMGLSNSSLGYLNYPTQVIFKCCKLIPTMIGGILIQGKKYHMLDVSAMMSMVIGLIWFTLADSAVQPNFNLYGVFVISLALVADGAIGNVQEKTMKAHNSTSTEMVLYSYGIGFVYIFIGLFLNGTLRPAFSFFSLHIVKTYFFILLLSVCGYLGMQFVLLLVRSYGALPAVTVTTCRKAVTIVLSFMFFTKPFTIHYLWGGILLIIGIYLNLYAKNKVKWDKSIKEYYDFLRFKLRGKRFMSLRSVTTDTNVV